MAFWPKTKKYITISRIFFGLAFASALVAFPHSPREEPRTASVKEEHASTATSLCIIFFVIGFVFKNEHP